ncbi:carboxypeptidase-like regulatory domain-containing protein [uncultured Tenacibaculum sp.]|uniref:carboxypeptidase-like regulatory domain-containing protein n=1 Tax=uncultured Tenacibaculum sp. TaxID=174713 RepID=UPI0026359B92|nr:carboxypeptidase-like regulatory domain-containing protein [uncultured Tenacibaculum sp.]
MESSLPIIGLACPGVQSFDTGVSPNQVKCGCTMKKEVKGKVIDSVTGLPFEAGLVNVYNVNTKKGTTTQVNGTFVIEASPQDTIQISFVEYQTVKVIASQLPADVSLKADEMLEEVVITSSPKSVKNYGLIGVVLLGGLFVYAIAKDEKKKSKTANSVA